MTKSGKKDAPKAAKPKLKRETLKDLDPKGQGEEVRGGAYKTQYCQGGGGSGVYGPGS